MTGHVVLCGLNELGYQTLEELHHLGEEVVVVARAPARSSPTAPGRSAPRWWTATTATSRRCARRACSAPPRWSSPRTTTSATSTPLVAHDLNPRLRMFNQELGRRVQLLFRDCQVLDAAAIAVPAFVSAALHRDRQQRLQVDGRSLVVRRGRCSPTAGCASWRRCC